ncbi:MAG: hypothetical protein DME60_01765 [Verrucomicrobia bacterium]|nr:MAG: hypothetical protein DME60_01765 [Verrucomicrobiota bacterium]
MIFLPEYLSNAESRRIYSSILAASDSESFRVNPRYLPERISGAVAQSRIYHRVRMEFTNLCSLGCAWNQWTKPSAQSKRRKMSLFLIQPWTLQFDPETFRG